jgi:hypothetical protein
MQLELEFIDQNKRSPKKRSTGPWDRLDPRAQKAALEILARLIAQMLAAQSKKEANDE